MQLVFAVMWQEILVLWRDKRALALLFIMPAALIMLLTLALTDIYFDKMGKNLSLRIQVEETSEISDQIKSHFESEGYKLQFEEGVKAASALGDDKQERHIDIWIPKVDSTVLKDLNRPQSELFTDKIKVKFSKVLDNSYRKVFLLELSRAFHDITLEKLSQQIEDVSHGQIKPKFINILDYVQEVEEGTIVPNPVQQTVPAWTLFAMFFIVVPISNSIFRDRESGITDRILSYPVRKSVILAGKMLPYLFVNLLQFICMLTVGVLAAPLLNGVQFEIGEINAALVLVTVSCSLAALGYALLISTMTKTSEQAAGFGSLSIVILAVIGGVMIPRFAMPSAMQSLAMLSPLHWGLEAYQSVFLRADGLSEVLQECLVLAGFAVVCFCIGLLKFRWSRS
ncbi:MAG: ABC transporter permease [Oligoflexales bacterium]